jgi:hypothetical protein
MPQLADFFFGQPREDRACGACVACCFVWPINAPELQKPSETLCPHCTGANCAIYDARPPVCRAFDCGWRRIEGMPDFARPDRLGIIFDVVMPDKPNNVLDRLYVRGTALHSWADFESENASVIVDQFSKGDLPVWLEYGDEKVLAHPFGEIADILLGGAEPSTVEAAEEAERWRVRFSHLTG